jgi:hypothetical protein
MLAFCQGCVCKKTNAIMPALVAGIHVLLLRKREDVDGRGSNLTASLPLAFGPAMTPEAWSASCAS